ncbi:conserved hypothetical protein [Vibrio chagasii]|uniref:hypothetical protein n=1 Tax=Vibrio splendidus TaxID=29497 RepID=UPI000E32687B|nr:hypothetical protein [Vibrio splendidus]CAH6821096.1 conserved hypothetical protein [Vibrio chagasii]CAH6825266.1 conserved hypothetical protein [Vibrio chagasii]CAH6835795.1 conserved hypothetical protein [Vibrio chagasii]CAH6922705.1 conserved hypothetical protein [Vibrio chagasii]CAH6947191.1 conserved hypothetical protein [Vibrio chagasii]
MKRLLLMLASTSPFHSSANDTLVESIERFTDIFSISFSQLGGSTVTTLDANYQINEKLRVFGDIDTNVNWEVGAGYSFWQGQTYYTENTFKVSEYKLTTGIFVAKLVHDDWTLIGDTNYNYTFDQEYCIPETCVNHKAANSVDYSAGFLWSPIRYADFLFKYNQEIGIKKDEWYWKDRNIGALNSRKNIHYYELATFINLKYIKPSVTYTIRPEADNYVEFGLAFDF